MTQLNFSDAKHAGKRKRTRREIFLAEMEQVVPWQSLLALLEPHNPKRPVAAVTRTRWRRCCASTCCSSGTR